MSIVKPLFTKIVDNLLGAEGPVFDQVGNFYMVAPGVEKDGKPAGQIFRVDLENKQASVCCEPSVDGYGGIPAGCQSDKEGNIYVADMRLGILLMKSNGDFKQLALKDNSDRTMQGCNDCIFDYTGTLWVTGPAGDIAPMPYRRSFEEAFGSVYCLTPSQEVIRIDTGIFFPNGIAVAHDKEGQPKILIVAETPTRILWAYDIEGPGQIKGKRKWGELPESAGFSGPDGMDFDVQGNLLVAHHGSNFIDVFGPDGGKPIKRIECPFQQPSNVHFYPRSKKVLVTEHDNNGLWEFEWECEGMPQFCEK